MRTIIVLLLLVLSLVAPASACRGIGTACKSNVKNLATALEMYASDHSGHYPANLSELVPEYLKTIPVCPGAGCDTYSESYISRQKPDRYLVYCSGLNHEAAGLPLNSPSYTSDGGSGPRDELTVDECRVRLKKHLACQHKEAEGDWVGCWGNHLQEGVAYLEYSSTEGYSERATVTLPAEPPSTRRAWWGPITLVVLLSLGRRRPFARFWK